MATAAPTSPAYTRLQWQVTPDVFLAKREATRSALMGYWLQAFQGISPAPPRLVTVMRVIQRYRRNVSLGLQTLQEAGLVIARYHEESHGALTVSPTPRTPRARWWRRKVVETINAPDLSKDRLKATRDTVRALEQVLATWTDLTIQHDEISLLMALLDQDLGVILATPQDEPETVQEPSAPILEMQRITQAVSQEIPAAFPFPEKTYRWAR